MGKEIISKVLDSVAKKSVVKGSEGSECSERIRSESRKIV